MLGFVQNWFAPKANPIGVDFGSDSLRMAQVRLINGEYQLAAAASADVPSHVRNDPQARFAFFVDTVRDLLSQGKFIGRQTVLSLPASMMHIQHLRLPRMDEQALAKALPWEVRGKIPIDPAAAVLRHVLAGEVYADNDTKFEVIVMAAAREIVNQYLAAAAKARLDVVGMNVEPKALIDCFTHIFRRADDAKITNLFVDIGCNASRAIIARGEEILFARTINIGGEHFNRAVAAAFDIGVQDAKILRLKVCAAEPATPSQSQAPSAVDAITPELTDADTSADVEDDDQNQSFALLGAALSAHARQDTDRRKASDPTIDQLPPSPQPPSSDQQARRIEQACTQPLMRLIEELDLCRRYYESAFPSKPVDRLIFVGGEARQRSLCLRIAREMGLAAQIGDPLIRMAKTCRIGLESGIDPRQPQPGWAVAIGLSMGPAAVTAEVQS